MGMAKFVCLVFILGVCFSIPAFAQNLQQGLIAYWAFDGNGKDGSGKGYNAEENGKVVYADGKVGKAVDLEAAGAYLVVPNNIDIQLKSTESFTVSLHVKPNSIAHGDILYHGLGCSTWASWFLGLEGGEPDAARTAGNYVFGVRSANGAAYQAAMSEAEVGNWVHIAVTYEGDTLKMFIDGAEQDSQDIGILPYDSQEKLHIGGDPGCGGRAWYNGLIDDVCLYNRAVTKAEITILSKGGLAVNPSGGLAITWGEVKGK